MEDTKVIVWWKSAEGTTLQVAQGMYQVPIDVSIN